MGISKNVNQNNAIGKNSTVKEISCGAKKIWDAERATLRRDCPWWPMPAWSRAPMWRRRPYIHEAVAAVEAG